MNAIDLIAANANTIKKGTKNPMDMMKLIKPDFVQESGDLWPAIGTVRGVADILEAANRTPDESVKSDLISAAKKSMQDVIDALTETTDPEPNDDD